jgi:Flp pilus assembly protein TadD
VEKSVEVTQRTYIKLVFGALLGVVLLAALIWGGHGLYVRWLEKRLVRRATADIARGDERDANLAARTILEMRPTSPAGARIMAELAERRGDRSVLDWRRRVAQLDPHSVHDALALARSALQFNDVVTAKRSLDAVDENNRNTGEYHAAVAKLAQASHNDEKADQEWSEALRLAPQDSSYKYQLGLLRLRATDSARRASGQELLTELRADPAQRVQATRALLADGAQHHINNDTLLDLARELQAYPEATFSDRLLYLDILRQLRAPDFAKYLTSIEQDSISQPPNLTALITWMTTSGLSLVAIDFARGLPPETLTKWPVPLAMAEAYAKLHDWTALEGWVRNKDWTQSDFMRHAYLALALRGQNKTVDADKEWALAQKEASVQPALLSLLTRATSDWRWEKEWTELLWTLTKYPETQFEALQNLYQKYSNDGDTTGLYRVLVRLVELVPDDERIQNNFAQVCLLLNADVERARKLAEQLYRKEPTNPAYASTYAYALYTKGDTKGALKIIGALNETQLREPSVAAYYGVLLAAGGSTQDAREYLKLGTAAKLLPEEKALIKKAESSLQ